MTLVDVYAQSKYVATSSNGRFVPMPSDCLTFTDEVAAALRAIIPDDGVEHVAVVAMDCHGKPIGWTLASTGTVDAAMLYPRDIFAWLLTLPAVRLFGIAHNHPSGVTTPSGADIQGTGVVAKTGQLFPLTLRWSAVISHDPATWELVPMQTPKPQGDERTPDLPQDPDEPQDEPEPGDEPSDEPEPGDEPGDSPEDAPDTPDTPDTPEPTDEPKDGAHGAPHNSTATTATTDDVRNALQALFGRK